MKIAIVSPYDLGRHGGVQDQATKLTGWLRATGHDVTLLGPGATDRHIGAVSLGPVVVIPANRSRTPITLSPRARSTLAAVAAEVDVVHLHEPFMPVVSWAALTLRDVPMVGTFHADPSSTMRRIYRLAAPLLRRTIRRLAAVTAVSGVAASALRPLTDEVTIVPNAIDLAAQPTGPKQRSTVLFVGRDDPRKGLQVLLTAWPQVRASHPDADLVVLGRADPRLIEGVDFLGPAGDDAKRDRLATTEILCAPNLGGESFGLVVAEGMAAGCAVVASAIPAFADVLGDTGRLVPPGDAAALAEALGALLADADEVERLGGRARARAARFDLAEVGRRYLDVYEHAVASRRRRAG